MGMRWIPDWFMRESISHKILYVGIIIVVILLITMITGCIEKKTTNHVVVKPLSTEETSVFTELGDPDLLNYVEETVYDNLITDLDSEEYFIENIDAIYISKEYIEEVNYNSQSNIYFGYTLKELNEIFKDKKYVFTLGEDGSTVVKEFEEYE